MKFRKNTKNTAEINTSDKYISKQDSLVKPKEEVNYGPLHIYFGSQTGTAANYSQQLGEEAAKNGFTPKVIDLIDFEPRHLKSNKLVAFLMATHGEGDPTDNAKAFNDWLIDAERTADELKNTKFCVFGLGNKQYQFYNAQGRRVNQYLEKLGAERIYKYGEGDDDGTLEDDFNEWKSGLWNELKNVAEKVVVTDTNSQQTNRSKNNLPFNLTITKDKEIDFDTYNGENDDKPYEFQMKQYLSSSSVNVNLIKELRQKTDDGSTLHIELDTGSVGLNYKTAENLVMFPENTPESVEKISKLLGLNLDDVFNIEENMDAEKKIKFKYPFPTPISVRTYLTKFCDLNSALRKKQLKDLAEFCVKAEDKEKLLLLSSPNGKVEFEAQISSRMLGLIDIIEKFNLTLDLASLINVASLIQPRYYTIASSNRKYPNSIHLCFAMQLDILSDGSKRLGLTSSFFTRLFKLYEQGKSLPKIKVSVKESTFILPSERNSPIYMVGPGAGLAPFKGFIEEKVFAQQEEKDNPYGPMTLYFGCKGRNWDYLYKPELLKYHEDKVLENYHVAFSREQEQKVYVQDLIEKHQDIISKDLFEKNMTFYICGGMGMGKAVIKKLIDCAAAYYKIEVTEATKKIEDMEKKKKIIKELWG